MSELMDIVIDCENQLGLHGPIGMPLWRARVNEMGKLRKRLNSDPQVTTQDLRLAIAWCRRRREPIASVLELFTKINDAKQHAVVAERGNDLTGRHRAAIRWEQEQRDEHSSRWISRLVRCIGPMREDVLTQWTQAGRG